MDRISPVFRIFRFQVFIDCHKLLRCIWNVLSNRPIYTLANSRKYIICNARKFKLMMPLKGIRIDK